MGTIGLRSYHGTTPDEGFEVLDSNVVLRQEDFDFPDPSGTTGMNIPLTGRDPIYSYVKNFQVYVNEDPSFWVGNFRLYFARKPTVWANTKVFVTTSSDYVNPIIQGTAPLEGFVDNVGRYGINTPLVVDGYEYNGDGIGGLGDWIQMQVCVQSTSFPGILDPITMHLKWQEWTQL